jgi:hypothetical protein
LILRHYVFILPMSPCSGCKPLRLRGAVLRSPSYLLCPIED